MDTQRQLPFYVDPRHPVGVVLLAVVAGVLLWLLGLLAPKAGWLAATVAVPIWLALVIVAATAWLLVLAVRDRRAPVFHEGAYYEVADRGFTHPYCMHCWEHSRKLVSVKHFAPKDDLQRYDCVTHHFYEWGGPGGYQPPSPPRAVGSSRIRRRNI